MVIGGKLDLGTIAAFLQYTRSFSQPITQISQLFNAVLAALAGAERIFEIIDLEPEQDEGYVTLVNAKRSEDGSYMECAEHTGLWAWKHPHKNGTVTYEPLTGDVRFFDVTFSYDGRKTVLKDVSLYAKPGQKIAFVGSTGAGKTTITNLLLRFWEPQTGSIRIGGLDIREMDYDYLLGKISVVMQNVILFSDTIANNIKVGNQHATQEEIEDAARRAMIHDFIINLPEGYETKIGENGLGLSGGQKQRLSIARAFLKDAPIILLDEITSNVDPVNEYKIQQAMSSLIRNRTVLVIAHHLQTIRNANQIIVMDKGHLVEYGTHAELAAKNGMYCKLLSMQ